jgi:hypothetical protein
VPRVAAIPTGLYQRDLPWEQVAAAVTDQIKPQIKAQIEAERTASGTTAR